MKNKLAEKIEIKKQKIIEAAIKILNQKEFHKCPVEDIAKLAGVAKGTIYLYFKNKEDLYFKVFFHLITQIKEIAQSTFETKISAKKQIYLFLNKVDKFIIENANVIGSMRPELKSIDKTTHEKMNKQFYELVQSVSQIIQRGIAQKEFKKYPPELVASMLLSFLPILAHRKIEKAIVPFEFSLKTMTDILLKGISKKH